MSTYINLGSKTIKESLGSDYDKRIVVSSAYGFLFSSTTSGDGETDDDKNRNVQHSLSERLR